MGPLLQISGLSVDYATTGGGRVHALRGVDLEVCAGETVDRKCFGTPDGESSGKGRKSLFLLKQPFVRALFIK